MSTPDRPRRVLSKTFTFHLDPDTAEKLTIEAEEQDLSVNVIANRALRKYVEWEVISDRSGFVSTNSSFLHKLMTWVPDEQIRELGRWQWFREWRTIATEYYGGQGIEPRIRILDLFGRYGRMFHFDQATTGSTQILTLFHGRGRKWSLFYEGVLEAMLRESIEDESQQFSLTSTENQVVAEIRARPIGKGQAPDTDMLERVNLLRAREEHQ